MSEKKVFDLQHQLDEKETELYLLKETYDANIVELEQKNREMAAANATLTAASNSLKNAYAATLQEARNALQEKNQKLDMVMAASNDLKNAYNTTLKNSLQEQKQMWQEKVDAITKQLFDAQDMYVKTQTDFTLVVQDKDENIKQLQKQVDAEKALAENRMQMLRAEVVALNAKMLEQQEKEKEEEDIDRDSDSDSVDNNDDDNDESSNESSSESSDEKDDEKETGDFMWRIEVTRKYFENDYRYLQTLQDVKKYQKKFAKAEKLLRPETLDHAMFWLAKPKKVHYTIVSKK